MAVMGTRNGLIVNNVSSIHGLLRTDSNRLDWPAP
jgi:hypothetical protein